MLSTIPVLIDLTGLFGILQIVWFISLTMLFFRINSLNKTSCVLITLIIITCSLYGDSIARPDAVTSASKTIIPINQRNQTNSKVLIILATSSQGNTQIISNALQQTLNADVVSPENVSIEMLTSYQLIGFGSGIFDEKHHSTLLSFARNLNQCNQMKVFIFLQVE